MESGSDKLMERMLNFIEISLNVTRSEVQAEELAKIYSEEFFKVVDNLNEEIKNET